MVRELSGCEAARVGSFQNDPKGNKTLWPLCPSNVFFHGHKHMRDNGKQTSWISARLCAARRVLPVLVLHLPILSEVQGVQAS